MRVRCIGFLLCLVPLVPGARLSMSPFTSESDAVMLLQ
jgi:hypothetical protein